MSSPAPQRRTNRELLKELRTPVARFYPFDFHTHSVASYDVCVGNRYAGLPEELQNALSKGAHKFPLAKEPTDHGQFDRDMASTEFVEAFYAALCKQRDAVAQTESIAESDNWSIIGVTDHNVAEFAAKLSILSWEKRSAGRLIVLPGIELEVQFPVEGAAEKCPLHILCLYQPGTAASDIRLAINECRSTRTTNWDFGTPISLTDLPQFVQRMRGHVRYPAICIAAHVWSSKGIASEPKKVILRSLEADIVRLEAELERATADNDSSDKREIEKRLEVLVKRRDDKAELHLTVLRLIGQCGFDGLQVHDRTHEAHYRRLHRFREEQGRAIPIVCSDSHTPSGVLSSDGQIPFVKLDATTLSQSDPRVLFDEVRKRALRFGETRTTYSSPGAVSYWIEGIEIVPDAQDAREFWQVPGQPNEQASTPRSFTLPLSRNLNCFVGGRGSGKSSLIESLAFLTQGQVFKDEASKKEQIREDWYRRAEATLRGCQLRLVWKTTATTGIGALPKRALVVSRYFDPDGRHQDPEIRDADGNAIVDTTLTAPSVRLLRAHEIERTAQADNLRKLFDDLCGNEIITLTNSIEQLRTELATQRGAIVSVCKQIGALTNEAGPLRQYGIRKKQFEVVDKPELRERFEQVDQAESVNAKTAAAYEAWTELDASGALSALETELTEFFDTTAAAVVAENGDIAAGYEPLHALARTAADPEKPGLREQALLSIRSTVKSIDTATNAFSEIKENAATLLQGRRDQLAKDGLPTGSSEREAKKRAFNEAKTDHQQYQTQLARLKELMAARQTLFEQLVAACQSRTHLRKTRAESLTAQLQRDLDGDVLRIEVDAKPLADRQEFGVWLETHMDAAFQRYKVQRRAAIIASGLMPAALREVLLHDGSPDMSALKNHHDKAEDGRVNDEDCTRILDACRGRKSISLDEADQWNEEFIATLPQDLQAGVVVFPATGQQLCIDHVLALDEVVLDDLPEIRLNDRPSDTNSVPRPLRDLSPGQRCSAILPILLLSGDYPLIIDQPEENLDNRLIRQVIVNILASMKLRRQVIIATHNPNLPVLGDVEQCVVLQASGRDLSSLVAIGNLDSPQVARYITDIMEGGREAFQYRQSIYQIHWDNVIEATVE